jgi:hypothetical protein
VGVVVVSVAQVAAVEDLGLVEKGVGGLVIWSLVEFGKEVGEGSKFGEFEVFEFDEFIFATYVVGEIVGFGADSGDVRGEAVEFDEEGDEAGGVGGEGQVNEVVDGGELFRKVFLILGDGGTDFGLGFVFPFFSDVETAFDFPNGGVVLVEAFFVGGAEFLLESGCPLSYDVKDASANPEIVDAALDLCFVAREEERFEDGGRGILRRDHDSAGGEGEGLADLLLGNIERKSRDSGKFADVLGGKLVEGDGVAEGGSARMRGGGEEGDFCGVATGHIGVRTARDDSELIAEFLEGFQIGSEFVLRA